jgi:predicted metal-dependent enzyme (double-stranded beta helix superfamily)
MPGVLLHGMLDGYWGSMMHEPLRIFIETCESIICDVEKAADRVTAIAPLMQSLAADADNFLSADHFHSDLEHYARNAIYIAPSGNLSLFALVWLPGQWTPVHDHGCWGVVGIVRGVLEERSYMSATGNITAASGIRLKRGGVILLNPGSVSSFVPNPDHIHRTGVPQERETCVSLHLYGRNMNSYHIYDLEAGTRRMVDVPHHESR